MPGLHADRSAARPSLRLVLQTGPGIREAPATRAQLRRWILAALAQDAELTIRFSTRREARQLNRAYRGRDYAPDVLTFTYPLSPGEDPGPDARLRADIVVCTPVMREQALQAGIEPRARLAHLVIHATLHAQGHDHERSAQARRMEALEIAALARFGIANPYDSPR